MPRQKYIPFAIIIFYGVLYALTIPLGLTWAYDGADGGDFLTAITTGGVPHPSGYPTYLLFLQIFIKIPFGSLALRGNLFSLFCMLISVFILYHLTLYLTKSIFSATVASIFFGSISLIWSQAIITEVYALQTLLFILFLYLLFKKKRFSFGIATGFLLGNHLTGILALPLLFIHSDFSYKGKPIKKIAQNILSALNLKWLLGLTAGLSVYLLIPFRAQKLPPVNWGHVSDFQSFWWLISGAMYQERLSNISWAYILNSFQLFNGFLLKEIGIITLFLALFSAIFLFKPSKLYFSTIWIALSYSLFSIIYYSPDSYLYLIPVFISFSIWIGQSSAYILDKIPKKKHLKNIAISVSISLLLIQAIIKIPLMDISGDNRAEEYAQTILESAPKEAILITDSDEALFSLWYFHFAQKTRPDLAIISQGLFDQAWYRQTLRDTYPNLIVPNTSWADNLMSENPQRIICFLPNTLEPIMDCIN